MSSSHFRVAFEGEAFSDGEMDVRDLAPALLSLGEVIQAANRALNGERAQASLKMRAAQPGSFEALLSVDISFLTAIGDMLDAIRDNPERVVAADQLLDLLIKSGAVLGGVGTGTWGVLSVLKWLKGQRPDSIESRADGTATISRGATVIVVQQQTLRLIEDEGTRVAVENFAEKVLGNPRVQAVRFAENGLGNDASGADVVLDRGDLPALHLPPPEDKQPTMTIVEREVLLKIVTSAFRDGYKWRFSDGGEKPFTADIVDMDFVKELSEGKVSLSASDTLRCLIREEQVLDGGGVLRKDIRVLKVIEHIPGARQLRLL